MEIPSMASGKKRNLWKVLYLYAFIGFDNIYAQNPIATQTNRLLQETTDCIADLKESTGKYGNLFSQDAYLDFLNLRSKGFVNEKQFDPSIIQFVHEYWSLTCRVNPKCTTSSPVSIDDILDFSNENEEMSLVESFCSRVDKALKDINPGIGPTVSPTKASPSMSPTKTKNRPPSKSPTLSPSLSIMPTSSNPTKSPTLSPVKSPSRFPSLAPTYSSSSPSSSPTFRPSREERRTLLFALGFNNDDAEVLVNNWATEVAYDVLKVVDVNCTVETKSSCPYNLAITTFFIPQDCDTLDEPVDTNQCALAQISIRIDDVEEEILDSIVDSIKERTQELSSILE